MFAEIVATVIALALAALSSIFPTQSKSFYAIYLLSIFLLYLIFLCIRLYLRIRFLQKELEIVREKHIAVSARFDEKRISLAKHQAALQSLEYTIITAVASSNQKRLSILFEQLQKIKMSIIEGGDKN